MRIIYEPHQGMYLIDIEEPIIWMNTRDIVEAREMFIKYMTEMFNDAICEALED